jgi:hypothetical protein
MAYLKSTYLRAFVVLTGLLTMAIAAGAADTFPG